MKLFTLSLFMTIVGIAYAVESEDCLNLNTFLKRDLNTPCCDTEYEIYCNNDKTINKISLGNSASNADFMNFPTFPRLTRLSVRIQNLNGKILPSGFFNQPNLSVLTVTDSNITTIQENINYNCPVQEINLENNSIKLFPSHFKNLPNLMRLYMFDNKMNGIVDLDGFKALRQIDVSRNNIYDVVNFPNATEVVALNETPIKKIPDEVPYLRDLNVLKLNETKITEIPPDLFKLNKLKIFYLSHNPQLSPAIINFENEIEDCRFENTPILCYQENTCKNIDPNNYKLCDNNQINEIKSKQTDKTINDVRKNKNNNENFFENLVKKVFKDYFIITIIAIIMILLILLIIYCTCIKKKPEKEDKKFDIVVNEKIKKIRVYEELSSMDGSTEVNLDNKNNINYNTNYYINNASDISSYNSNDNNPKNKYVNCTYNYNNNNNNNSDIGSYNSNYNNESTPVDNLDDIVKLPSYRTRERPKHRDSEKPPTYSVVNAIPVVEVDTKH